MSIAFREEPVWQGPSHRYFRYGLTLASLVHDFKPESAETG